MAIVNNEDLSRKGKRKSLKPTFNEQQKKMQKEHRELIKKEREKFKSGLNEEQLVLFEELQNIKKMKNK